MALAPSIGQAETEVFGVSEPAVLCHGYDEATETCFIIQRLAPLENGAITFNEMFRLDLGTRGTFSLAMQAEAEEANGLLCFPSPDAEFSVEPKFSTAANYVKLLMKKDFEKGVGRGYCIEHHRCGGQHVATVKVGGFRRRPDRTLFTAFTEDDPQAKDLILRTATRLDLHALARKANTECPSP